MDARHGSPELAASTVPVWSLALRLLHAALIATVALAALAVVPGLDTAGLARLHQPAGYGALAVVALRGLLGVVGRGEARFSAFVRGPRATLRYAGAVLRRREPHHLGHNPLGGWMAIALMACVAGLALTGWLYTTDAYFGDERVETAHRALAWTLLALVVLHLGGVLFTSRRQGENLVAAMCHGRKRAPGAEP